MKTGLLLMGLLLLDMWLFTHILSIRDQVYNYNKPQYTVGDTVYVKSVERKVIITKKDENVYKAFVPDTEQEIQLYTYEISRIL